MGCVDTRANNSLPVLAVYGRAAVLIKNLEGGQSSRVVLPGGSSNTAVLSAACFAYYGEQAKPSPNAHGEITIDSRTGVAIWSLYASRRIEAGEVVVASVSGEISPSTKLYGGPGFCLTIQKEGSS